MLPKTSFRCFTGFLLPSTALRNRDEDETSVWGWGYKRSLAMTAPGGRQGGAWLQPVEGESVLNSDNIFRLFCLWVCGVQRVPTQFLGLSLFDETGPTGRNPSHSKANFEANSADFTKLTQFGKFWTEKNTMCGFCKKNRILTKIDHSTYGFACPEPNNRDSKLHCISPISSVNFWTLVGKIRTQLLHTHLDLKTELYGTAQNQNLLYCKFVQSSLSSKLWLCAASPRYVKV